ncbi:unnamed protein product [Effrenium voratum]|nr:unnamed protein product [Effrenium voratum]
MHSPPEAVLAASLLLGLQRSRASEEDVKDSALHPEEHAELDATRTSEAERSKELRSSPGGGGTWHPPRGGDFRLRSLREDPGSGEVLFLVRLREVAEMLAFIAFFAGVFYIYVLSRQPQSMYHMSAGSFFEGTKEYREARHIFLWAFLAPQQWVMHARLYTKASVVEAGQLMLITAYTMVFGLMAVQVDMDADSWIRPHLQVRILYTLSTLSMISVFVKASRMPMEPLIAKTGNFYLKVKYVVWSGYPVAYMLRSLGVLSAWQEEVLVYTSLDVVAKSLSLIASSTGPLFTLFLSTWGHWHISGGMHDFRVTVQEPDWGVQSVEMDRSTEKGEQATGLRAGQSNFLRDAVDAEDAQRLQRIAQQVDTQLSFMAQKTPITVKLGNVSVGAECYVSRSLWGSRQLAITVRHAEASKPKGEDDAGSLSSRSSSAESETKSKTATLTSGKVALHQYLAERTDSSEVGEKYWQTRLASEQTD